MLLLALASRLVPILLDLPRPVSESECATIRRAEADAGARAEALDARFARLTARGDEVRPGSAPCPHVFAHGGDAAYGWGASPTAAAIRASLRPGICERDATRTTLRAYVDELRAYASAGDVELVVIATHDLSEGDARDEILETDALEGRAYVLDHDAVACVASFPTLGPDGRPASRLDSDYGDEGGDFGRRDYAHLRALHSAAERDVFAHLRRVE